VTDVPFHLKYALTRRQRLVPHLKIWLPYLPGALGLAALGVFVVIAKWWLFPLLPLFFLFFRAFWIGLLDVLLHQKREMDIIIDQNGLGFLIGGERFWLFLDGILWVERTCSDTWTISHFNGHAINIPVSVISDGLVECIRQAAAKGKTPEGMKAIIERGRRLQQMEQARAN
jgi:hypothetical protein